MKQKGEIVERHGIGKEGKYLKREYKEDKTRGARLLGRVGKGREMLERKVEVLEGQKWKKR